MKLSGIVMLGILLGSTLLYGQAASAPAQAGASVGHGSFPAKVTKTLDSSKLKQDDSIEIETAGTFKLPDGTLVPKGSRISGRVVDAKARSKGDPDSQLTLAFDKLNIAGGKQLSIKATVQALYPPAEEPMGPNMASAGTSQGGSAHGSTVGGGGVSSGGVGITNSNSGSNTESAAGQSVMDMKYNGVQGMHDLSLDNGVLTSKGKNVKLGNGVRLVLSVEILG